MCRTNLVDRWVLCTRLQVHAAFRAGVICVMTMAAAPCVWADSMVLWANGQLTVKAGGQSLAQVLGSVGETTGIHISGATALNQPVPQGFVGLPLLDGLRLLLAGQNYMIIEGGRAVATRVIIAGGPDALASLAPVGHQARAAARSPRDLQPKTAQRFDGAALERALDDTDAAARVEAVERLGERSDERSLAYVGRALHDSSEAVRASAKQILAARASIASSAKGSP